MMQHPDEGKLHAYLDGELSPSDVGALEQHVAACAHCSGALAEARGLVAGATRVVSALDAAPSSAGRSGADAAAGVSAAGARPRRRPLFRAPFAQAAALLLLAGGAAVVLNRSGGVEADLAARILLQDSQAAATVSEVAPLPEDTTRPLALPDALRSPADVARGSPVRSAPRPQAERGLPPVASVSGAPLRAGAPGMRVTTEHDFSGRGVAGGTALPVPNDRARRDSVRWLAPPSAPPPPSQSARAAAAAPLRLSEVDVAAEAPADGHRMTRYLLENGTVVTLTEAPLRRESADTRATASRRSPALAAKAGRDGQAAQAAAAPPVNSYSWSSVERGRTYTLTGPVTVAELEAAARRLAELERVP